MTSQRPHRTAETGARAKRTHDWLDLAPGLLLDADEVAGGSLALLGNRGAGKTATCRVLAEELFAAKVQTVILDPMGAFWGLRSSADGTAEGLPIPVFGGDHADAPLESSAGTLMADLVVDEGLSMILDMSGFGSRTQERTFAAAFLERLYRRNSSLVHLIVDEADLLAPQKPRREDARLLVTMENIVRRGRNRGIGCTMASQRPAVLSKDVLSQVGMLVAMRMTAPQDRDAIREWVRGQADEESWRTVAPSLPGLEPGEAWWWLPDQHLLERRRARLTHTFDSSRTLRRGTAARSPKVLADVDLTAISARISATVERAKDSDPKVLHRRIADLERQVREALPAAAEPQVVTRTVPDPEQVERLEALAGQVAAMMAEAARSRAEFTAEMAELVDRLTSGTDGADRALNGLADEVRYALARLRETPATQTPATPLRTAAAPPSSGPPNGTVTVCAAAGTTSARSGVGEVSPARLRLLDALRSLEGIGVPQVPKTQLALWAGVSPKSSGYSNNLGALRSAGLIDYPAPGLVTLTDGGRELTVADDVPATTAALHEHVRSLVSPARWRVLEPLLAAYPGSLGKADLAEKAGVSAASSGYNNNLGALRSLGLIDYPAPGTVAATGVLFLTG